MIQTTEQDKPKTLYQGVVMSKKRSAYQEQLGKTHRELHEHMQTTSATSRLLKGGSSWIILWSLAGMGQSLIQISPLLTGTVIGLMVFITGLLAWRTSWVILEFPVSLYVGGMAARYFITSPADQPLWLKWILGLSLGAFCFIGYWGMKDAHKILIRLRDKATQNIARLQSRLTESRQAFARRTVKRQRYRNTSGSTDFTENEWMDLCFGYNYTCLRCKRQEPEIMLTPDHVIPLARGGANTIDNIQPLCMHCNTSKNARTIDYRGGNQ
jgi:5-methylcytosine-specific restriction endonuclease McrA